MSTYTPLASTTLTDAASFVTIGNIPQTYTDLVLVATLGITNPNTSNVAFRFNSDTGTNFSVTRLYGNGSTAGSNRDLNNSFIYGNEVSYPSGDVGENNYILHIMNYSNSTTYKTTLSRGNRAATGTDAIVGLWRSTAAITSVTVLLSHGSSYAAGSMFSLYGIAAGGPLAFSNVGATVTTDGAYWYHTFTSSGIFTPTKNLTVDALIVAGGGGTMGTTSNAGGFGGGGAGGLRSLTSLSITSGVATTVTVGAGGAGGAANLGSGSKGGNSTFDIYSATGGGIGSMSAGTHNGGAGGSGGGARTSGTGGLGNQGSYSPSEGNNGGITTAGDGAAGGGGAGAVGGNCTSDAGGNGGAGTASSITGTSVTYAGGGGGGGFNYAAGGTGGAGGGGNGKGDNTVPDNGTVNTGGGAGGSGGLLSGGTGRTGASGGSGIVIIRYPV